MKKMKKFYEDSEIMDRMTICIAAIAKEGDKEYAVMAVDKGYVLNYEVALEFGGYRKFRFFKRGECAVMSAGSLAFFDSLVSNFPSSVNYSGHEKQLFDNYGRVKINQQKNQLNTVLLLVGVDEMGQIKITEINDKGYFNYTDFGFCCIGIGKTTSFTSLNCSKQLSSCSVKETVYNVYKAKKVSEAVQGIGKETDIVVFSKDSYKELDKKDFDTLEKIFNEELEYGKNHKDLDKIKFQ